MQGRAASVRHSARTVPMTKALSPNEELRVQRGLAESTCGDGIVLTEKETKSYAETGILPERMQIWFGSRG